MFTKKALFIHILAAWGILTSSAQTAIVPSTAKQQRMLDEERSFLSQMKPGLQHTQMLAVRAAISGHDTALQQIRQSRNVAPALPEGVKALYPTPNLCVFMPDRVSTRQRPVLLYLHGGGWCFGSINSCTRFCAALAMKADCCVAALNYRLSPANSYPAPLDDCKAAFAYLKQHATEWGGDTTQVSVGGDSAGGNLALSTALSVRGVCKVIPIYPVTKVFTVPSASWQKYAQGYGNDAELLEAFNEAYARHEAHNPRVSPGLASDSALQCLPPMLILSAGHDILFDQTAELASRLQRVGHPLRYHVFPTATHLFITVPGQPTAVNEAVNAVADVITSAQ